METKTENRVPTATNEVENNPNRVTPRSRLPKPSQISMDLSKELGFSTDLRFGQGNLSVGVNQSAPGSKSASLIVPNSEARFSLGILDCDPSQVWIGNKYANFSAAPALSKDKAAQVLPKLTTALAQTGAHPNPQKPVDTRVIYADSIDGSAVFVTTNLQLAERSPASYRIIVEKDGKYTVHTPTSVQLGEKELSFAYGANNKELSIKASYGACAETARKMSDPDSMALKEKIKQGILNPFNSAAVLEKQLMKEILE
ncbi:MAG: hypothetical protein GYA55_14285 [SAR324 cluster bacterium]|uniref:Uncharacterized protein n=1 Tax=SAR324 cluster bacterium TaxID=2024889 RepID=A0A7X9FV27_9DELT|nr:hypothetical protein [SAR324 cluster bacterium]